MYKTIISALLIFIISACDTQAIDNQNKAPTADKMSDHKMGNSNQRSAVKTPKIPFKYGLGMKKFQAMCGQCHGQWGLGSEQGPPLMHPFYKPSHHGDPAFYNAVLRGVRAHHWNFGDMPPVPGATEEDVSRIIPFIRWLQRENGIN